MEKIGKIKEKLEGVKERIGLSDNAKRIIILDKKDVILLIIGVIYSISALEVALICCGIVLVRTYFRYKYRVNVKDDTEDIDI